MSDPLNRRTALLKLGLGTASLGALAGSLSNASAALAEPASLIPAEASTLQGLARQLQAAPRRREFRSVPMILTNPSDWDHQALDAVMVYKGSPKQVWDNTDINGPWLNLMRNAVNAQIWSFKHPDFLAVSATHGSAHLALYDQTAWDKYGLAKQTKMASNTALVASGAPGGPRDYEAADGVNSGRGDDIPDLMRRGVVFLACHNAIWELAAKLQKTGDNPDKLSLKAMAADLTNHLIPGVVLTPGMVATIPELQLSGFLYIT
ncbi:MAG: thiosulfate dehydrogenase [Caulobacteraceae bacterium]